MPELPEVHTTATILNTLVKKKIITAVWTDYNSPHYSKKENIKDPEYFKLFKKEVVGKKILKVWRRAKNVLIDIGGYSTILIHMKMTGHLLHGHFVFNKKENIWTPTQEGPLQDSFNRFIHLVFSLNDGSSIVFCDMRKFATVHLIKDEEAFTKKFETIGPEPLEESFDWKILKDRLSKKPKQKIKTILMDQHMVAGIGNIYSDEVLWSSKINPERTVQDIQDFEFKLLTKHIKELLSKGISFGGDSMSDYRNPYGLPGEFQLHHNVYRRTGQVCKRKFCEGIIQRKVINGRSGHFCSLCQK
jgi:formamidopyrimidine-DNA glycosylase